MYYNRLVQSSLVPNNSEKRKQSFKHTTIKLLVVLLPTLPFLFVLIHFLLIISYHHIIIHSFSTVDSSRIIIYTKQINNTKPQQTEKQTTIR
jgi:hypothetical protein